MSLSSSRYHWYKVIAAALIAAQLWGCASTKQPEISVDKKGAEAELADIFEDFSTEEPKAQEKPAAEQPAAPPVELIDENYDALDEIASATPAPQLPELEPKPVLGEVTWYAVTGGPQGNAFTGVVEQRFKRPVAVAARGKYIYVVDQGANALYRVDQNTWRMEELLDLRTEVKGQIDDIYVTKDLSIYLTDTQGARVLQYDAGGDLVQVYRNQGNLVQPAAVTVFDNGDVVVADTFYDHLLRFNSSGKLIAAYGGRGHGVAQFTNITAMAHGPDGFYVCSRVGRKVQVIGDSGGYLYSFEEGAVIFPSAIVVNENNRSYVADHQDSRIKVFERGILVSELGRFGSAIGQFKRVSDLWLDDGVLYVADSLNGRIQYARIFDKAPASLINNLPQ